MKKLLLPLAGIAVFVVIAWAFFGQPSPATVALPAGSPAEATIYKSVTCGCCSNYAGELEKMGLHVKEVNLDDLAPIKEKYSIPEAMRTCHTVVIGDYFVEGHVPLEAVKKLLEDRPAVDGIVLPGMPDGSPGMPGLKTGAFTVYSLVNGKAASKFMVI